MGYSTSDVTKITDGFLRDSEIRKIHTKFANFKKWGMLYDMLTQLKECYYFVKKSAK